MLHHIKNTLITTGDQDLFLFRGTPRRILELAERFPDTVVVLRYNTTIDDISEIVDEYPAGEMIDVYVISEPRDSLLIKLAYNS